jgi:hypothetical protein
MEESRTRGCSASVAWRGLAVKACDGEQDSTARDARTATRGCSGGFAVGKKACGVVVNSRKAQEVVVAASALPLAQTS